MNQLLAELWRTAQMEQVVAGHSLDNGLHLLVYPLDFGALVGLGFNRDTAHRVHPESVLRRRSHNMQRFGAWMPAMLSDGGWYVVRRVEGAADSVGDAFNADELGAAQELIL